MKRIGHRVISAALLMVSLCSVLMGLAVSSEPAYAGLSGCRTDPAITLFDGTVIQTQAQIGTNMYDVQNVTYNIHAPAGSRVLLIVNTDGLLGLKERVVFYADAPSGTYTVDTIVYTGSHNINVTATSTVIRILGLDTGSASGRDRQHLRVDLNP
jgi:hypothetical protein